MRHRTAALLAYTAITTMIAAPLAPVVAAGQSADVIDAFAKLGARYIDELVRMSPVNGMRLGDHRFGNKLPDLSAAGRTKGTGAEKTMAVDLTRIDRSAVSRGNQVDPLLLDNVLRTDSWDAEALPMHGEAERRLGARFDLEASNNAGPGAWNARQAGSCAN